MTAILGGLGAAAFFATATLCSSRSSRMLPPSSVLAWVMLTGLVLVVPALAVAEPPAAVSTAELGWLALAGVGNVGGLLLAYSALRVGKVGIVAPIISAQGALAAVISVLAGEPLEVTAAWLLTLIATGIALAAAAPDPVPSDTPNRLRPILLAGAAAVVFGAALYATGRVSATLPVTWVLLPARLVGVLAIALPLLLTRRLRLTRRALPLVVVAGTCEVLGFGAFALGARADVAVAAVLASQFAAIAGVVAYLLFRERLSRLQVCGVTLVVVGVAALTAVQA